MTPLRPSGQLRRERGRQPRGRIRGQQVWASATRPQPWKGRGRLPALTAELAERREKQGTVAMAMAPSPHVPAEAVGSGARAKAVEPRLASVLC